MTKRDREETDSSSSSSSSESSSSSSEVELKKKKVNVVSAPTAVLEPKIVAPAVEGVSSGGFSFNFSMNEDTTPTPVSVTAPVTETKRNALKSLFHVYTDSDLTSFTMADGQTAGAASGVVRAIADNALVTLDKRNISRTKVHAMVDEEAEESSHISRYATKEDKMKFSFGFELASAPKFSVGDVMPSLVVEISQGDINAEKQAVKKELQAKWDALAKTAYKVDESYAKYFQPIKEEEYKQPYSAYSKTIQNAFKMYAQSALTKNKKKTD